MRVRRRGPQPRGLPHAAAPGGYASTQMLVSLTRRYPTWRYPTWWVGAHLRHNTD